MVTSTAAPSSLSAVSHAEHAKQAALHGFSGIVDEVGQSAANGFRIGQHRRQVRLEIALHGNAFEPAAE